VSAKGILVLLSTWKTDGIELTLRHLGVRASNFETGGEEDKMDKITP
jgi:hypothetical protein